MGQKSKPKKEKNAQQGQGSDPGCPYCQGNNKHGTNGRKSCKARKGKA